MFCLEVKDDKNIEKKLSNLLKHIWANSDVTTTRQNNAPITFNTSNGFLNINREGAKTYYSTLDLLMSIDEISNRVSKKIVTRRLADGIESLAESPKELILENTNKIASQVIIDLLTYPVEECVINIPIYGLHLSPSTFEINIGNVTIYSLGTSQTPNPAKWQDQISNEEIERMNSFLGVKNGNMPGGTDCWARVIVRANREDDDRQTSEGKRLVGEAIALLGLFMYSVPSSGDRFAVHSRFPPVFDTHDVRFSQTIGYIIELDINGKYWASTGGESKMVTQPYHITPELKNAFDKEGFEACSNALKASEPAPLLERIRRGLEYYSLAMRTPNIIQRYITCISALEALILKEDERESKGSKLSNRITWLLGQKPEEREKILSDFEDLYDSRFELVHGELRSAIQAEEMLPDVEWFLFSILRRLVIGLEQFTSVGDLAIWARRKSLGFT